MPDAGTGKGSGVSIHVMLCCNDWRDGNFEGRAECVEIEGLKMQGGSIRVNHENGVLQFGRLKVKASYKTWVGNWCWDMATVSAVDARRMLNYLIRQKWHCEEGACGLFDKINAGQEIGEVEWKEAEF
jgi:hypothetical protein